MKRVLLLISLFLVGTGWPFGGGVRVIAEPPDPPPPSMITAVIDGSRGASTATCTFIPCGVFFNASGTTHDDLTVDTFRDIHYSWNFDDAAAGGTWANGTSFNQKNTDCCSPLAYHTFEQAGTFNVKVTATDRKNPESIGEATYTLIVNDTGHSGSTYCVSTDSTFHANCPVSCPSANCITTSDFDAAIDSCGTESSPNKCLFERGEAWTVSQNSGMANGALVGAYGDPGQPRPTVTDLQANAYRIIDAAPNSTLMDIDFRRTTGRINGNVSSFGSNTQHALFLRNRIYGFHSGIGGGCCNLGVAGVNIYLVENEFEQIGCDTDLNYGTGYSCTGGVSTSGVGSYFVAKRSAMVGNSFKDTASHQVRSTGAEDTLYAHNTHSGNVDTSNIGGVYMKLHSPQPYGSCPISNRGCTEPIGACSDRYVIAHQLMDASGATLVKNNTFGGSRPQNPSSNECLRNMIYEGNHLIYNALTWGGPHFAGRNFTFRYNTLDQSLGGDTNTPARASGLTMDTNGVMPHWDQTGNVAYGNTCLANGPGRTNCINLSCPSGVTIQMEAKGNLLYNPTSPESGADRPTTLAAGGGGCSYTSFEDNCDDDGNAGGDTRTDCTVASNPFISEPSIPSTEEDFRLKTGHAMCSAFDPIIPEAALTYSGVSRGTTGGSGPVGARVCATP